MAIGLEDGSVSRNATLGTAGATWPLPVVMRPRPKVPSHVLTSSRQTYPCRSSTPW